MKAMSVESELTAALAYQRQTNGTCQSIIGMALEEVRRLKKYEEAVLAITNAPSHSVRLNRAINAACEMVADDDAAAIRGLRADAGGR